MTNPTRRDGETIDTAPATAPERFDGRSWRAVAKRYERPTVRASLWQVATSALPYVVLLGAMFFVSTISVWLALPLAIPAAGFMMRTFIVFHDCAHCSYFRSRRANDLVGRMCAVLVLTPFAQWRREHAVHHATAGDLERRGTGDVNTLTVREYLALPRGAQLRYRLYRNPLVMFCFGGLWFHLIQQRFPAADARERDRRSVHATNVGIVVVLGLLCWAFGAAAVALVVLPVVAIAGAVGIWLFYVQHQFEDAYWEHTESWNYADAALQGSSHLRLPRVLQWFSGNIGFHHVHHLSARIPNYRLQRCHEENPMLQAVPTLGLRDAWRTMRLKLWDANQQRMVGWRDLRAYGVR